MIRPALIAFVLLGCGAAPPLDPAFASPIGRDHPLVGRIWAVREGRFATEDELRTAVAQAEFVLVGEKHDNADHQRLEARVVGWAHGHTLVMEMIEVDRDAQVSASSDADGVGTAAEWAESGWPPFAHYRPIVEAALASRMTIVGGNVPTRTIMAIARGEPLPEDVAPLLAPAMAAPEPSPPIAQAMAEEMREAHCGMLPDRALAGMARVQWTRDALMADRLARAEGGAVLVAGAGHVRSDRGVPLHLLRARPDANVLTIALREVELGATDPADEPSPYDYLWFTPIATDEDPCEALRSRSP